jgi:ferredoxin--NADP+ reductase/benzoate/toluate 1,2-dioxygenase reductase subunit
MGNIRNVATFEELWFSKKAQEVRELVKTCPKNCWMVGTAAPVMKKYIRQTAPWVVKHKIKSLLGKPFDRNCLLQQFDVGQSPLQGDLRGGEAISMGDASMEMEDQVTTGGRMTATVLSNEKMTENVFLLEVERKDFLYSSGQNASIGPHLVYHKNRDYTFYSAPHENTLKFLIREVADGEISPLLMDVKPGDKVDVVGPYGDFTIQEKDNTSIKHLLIATGVGIGPFRSFITSHPDLDYKVIHGIRYVREEVMAREIDPDRYVSCVTAEAGGTFQGRVTDYLNTHEFEPDTYYYLCGNPHMLRDISDLLVKKGVPEEKIQVEPYYAY